jgi:osmotically-inducible protein OsmY
MKTDSQLQRDVQDELKWEPQVDHSQIGVAAKDGVVTLSGLVPSYAQKVAAEKAARRVSGVRAIAEEIEVRFASDPKTSDGEIAQRILDIFRWDVTMPDHLTVKVEHGRVTIGGTVDWNFEKTAAFKAASRINGVIGVTNLIAVRSRPTSPDIRERIVSAFKRSSLLDADSIDVDVQGSTVRLSGRVHGWNERKVAERAAWSAPGVTRVEDEIVLA